MYNNDCVFIKGLLLVFRVYSTFIMNCMYRCREEVEKCRHEGVESVERCRRECVERVEEVTGEVVTRDLRLEAMKDQFDHLKSREEQMSQELERFVKSHTTSSAPSPPYTHTHENTLTMYTLVHLYLNHACTIIHIYLYIRKYT